VDPKAPELASNPLLLDIQVEAEEHADSRGFTWMASETEQWRRLVGLVEKLLLGES